MKRGLLNYTCVSLGSYIRQNNVIQLWNYLFYVVYEVLSTCKICLNYIFVVAKTNTLLPHALSWGRRSPRVCPPA